MEGSRAPQCLLGGLLRAMRCRRGEPAVIGRFPGAAPAIGPSLNVETGDPLFSVASMRGIFLHDSGRRMRYEWFRSM